jgi:perosamine synthetase
VTVAWTIPFSGRAHAYTQAERQAVLDVMDHGATLTQGVHRDAFERSFGAYLAVPNAWAVCNATAAIELAAQLSTVPGDEVIVPGHTFTASAYPFLKRGATLRWADIDPATRVVTVETLERCRTSRTKVAVVVHLYGYAADMGAITAWARQHGIALMEDAAQALGTEVDGGKAGSFGDFAAFSFHSHKNITTLGEGGMLSVRDPEVARLVPLLRHNGHAPFAEPRDAYWKPAMGNVVLPHLGDRPLWPSNFCLGEAECALGTVLLGRLDAINDQKRRRAVAFIDALSDLPELEFHRVDSPRHNYHLLVAALPDTDSRDRFMRTMSQEHGIQCVVQYCPLYRYDLYRDAGMGEADCPATDSFFDRMVSFPFHHSLGESDLALLLERTRQVARGLYR